MKPINDNVNCLSSHRQYGVVQELTRGRGVHRGDSEIPQRENSQARVEGKSLEVDWRTDLNITLLEHCCTFCWHTNGTNVKRWMESCTETRDPWKRILISSSAITLFVCNDRVKMWLLARALLCYYILVQSWDTWCLGTIVRFNSFSLLVQPSWYTQWRITFICVIFYSIFLSVSVLSTVLV